VNGPVVGPPAMEASGGVRRVSDKEAERLGKGSAAQLLSAWRAAERDRVAAEETLKVAKLAAVAAAEAARAAQETSQAARLTKSAAEKAESAARRTSEAAELLSKSAQADQGSATESLSKSQRAEDIARDEYHDAQERGFPKA
jgi:hypothetical protein